MLNQKLASLETKGVSFFEFNEMYIEFKKTPLSLVYNTKVTRVTLDAGLCNPSNAVIATTDYTIPNTSREVFFTKSHEICRSFT